ncbi:MAG TPA: hypothetical protein VIC06_06070 [Solirubrobacteraceae bacterium]
MRCLAGKLLTRTGMLMLLVLALSAAVLAYLTSTGAGSASAGVTVLGATSITSATPGAGTVALSWSAVSPPGAGAVSYYVSRDGGAPEGSCPSSTATSTVTSCSDTNVSLGTHEYRVTAVWRSWTTTSAPMSAVVAFGPATHFILSAVSTTPTAGVADNLTITAKDEGDNTVATYAGLHSLTFAGAGNGPTGTHPTVSSSTGVVTNFGTATAISFVNGVAVVAGANNGVMTLYKAETALVTVTDGTLSNGAGLSVTVAAAAAASFSMTAVSTAVTAGEADNLTITALDAFGNVAITYVGSHSLTFGGAANSPNATHPTVSTSAGVATNFGTATAITFTNGVATVAGANNGVMRLYKAETASVTVAAGAVTNGAGLSVTVSVAAASSLGLVAATVTPTAGAGDSLTITAKDVYGNTITSYTGSHNLTFGGPHVIGAFTPTVSDGSGVATSVGTVTAITFTNGVASVSGASNGVMTLYKAEAVSVTVTDGTLSNGAGLAVTVGPAAAASLSLAAAGTTAGVADNLTVTVKDAYGNTVTSYAGLHNLTFEGAGNGPTGTHPSVSSSTGVVTNFGTATAISFVSGVATVAGANNGVMKLYKAETALVTVTDGTLSNGGGLSVAVAAAAAASFSMTAASTTPTAGEADNLTITALDAFGNVAITYVGSHSLTFGGAANSPNATHPTVSTSAGVATNFGTATAITFTNGVATVAGGNNGVMRLYKAETASVTVAAGAVTNGAGLSVTVSVAAASSLGLAAATVTPTAGASDNLTITAKDAYGNTITSYTGSHNLTFGGPHVIGPFTPTVSDGSGVATSVGTVTAITFTNGVASVSGASNGVMTLYKAEAVSVTVTDGTLSNGAGLAVTVGPAAAANLSLAAVSTTPTAGVADNLTVTVRDAYGNTVTSYAGLHNLTFEGAGNGPTGTHPSVSSSTGVVTNFGTATAISFVSGVAVVAGANNGVMKLYKAETALVTVTDGTLNNGAGLSVTVAAAAAASFSMTAVSTAVTAGEADNLTITALDAFGNIAITYVGSHNLTFGGAGTSVGGNHPTVSTSAGVATNFATATAITFTNGVATVAGANNGVMRLYKAETASVTVAAGAVTNGAGLSVTVSVAAASSLGLAAATVTPTAGAGDSLTITAKDVYGNTITSYTGSHNLTFGGPHVIGAFTPTVTDGSGVATNVGTATAITFTNGVASVSGASNGVMTLYKAEAVSVTVTDGTLSNGAGLAVTVGAASATSLSLAAASITPTAGVADNLMITAKDAYGNTATSYAGLHNLTFEGAGNSPNATHPTVSSSTGVVTNFGTATAISFVAGVTTVAGANNGVMKLYKPETALITVSDGTINNGAGLSVTVAAAAAASFSMTAASITPTAGEADNLTITALDAFSNVAITYVGSHNLTFGGAANSPNVIHPTVSSSTGVATNFATAEAITFTNGVATVAGANNGVMRLYKAETASVTVASGAVTNGAGLSVTVASAPASRLAWTHVTVSAGSLSAPCLFTCTVTTLGNAGTFTANVSVADTYGNTVSGLEAGYTVTVSTPSSGGGSGGAFTEPAAGTSLTLSISSVGPADSTLQFVFKAQTGAWVSDTMTAQTLTGTSYTSATATLNK